MAENRLVDIVLRVIFDRNQAQQTKRALTDVEKGVERIDSEARSARQSADAFFDTLEQGADKAQKSVKKISLGGISGGAGKLAQVAGGIGGGAAGEPLRLLGDFAGTLADLGPLAAAGGLAIGAVSLAFGELSRQSELLQQAAQKQIDAQLELIKLQQTATDEEAKATLDQLKLDRDAKQEQLDTLKELLAINDGTMEGLARYGTELAKQGFTASKVRENISLLEADLKGLGIQIEKFDTALEEGKFQSAEAEKNVKGFFEGLGKAVEGAETFVKDAAKGIGEVVKHEAAFLKQQKEEIAAAQQDYEDEILQLETDANEKRADLAKSLNDKLVELAQDAADGAAEALQSLEQDRADLLTQLGQEQADAAQQAQLDNLQAAIDFQREEERAARDHVRTLRSIRDKAADSELKQIADRDFQSLFFSRRQTARELSEASQTALDERQERQIAAEQAASDRARTYEEERRQALQNHQRRLNELQTNYNRELQSIAQNLTRQRTLTQQQYTADLIMLNQKLSAELNMRRDAITRELQFLALSEAERLRIITATQNALIQRANAMLGMVTGGSGTGRSQSSGGSGSGNFRAAAFALGGNMFAGQTGLVNDGGGTESFRARGNTVALPGGLGFFTPTVGGQVQPASGKSFTFAPNITISGNNLNEDKIVGLINTKTLQVIKEVFLS